ncbi:MAG: chromate transporter [Muribaculaceae bacterium]
MIYLRLIWSYLKIGFFGFGGGYAMLSLIQSEIVSPGWITEKMFTDIVAISQMTPGPIGINSATYIGYSAPMAALGPHTSAFWGVLGALICTLVVVIPSFLLTRYVGHFVARHRNSTAIEGIFRGLRPVVIGLIASAALILMNEENFGSSTSEVTISVIIVLATLAINLFTKIHPILLICAAGLAGYIIYI